MGRNTLGPVRGAWPDETWRGWWGEEPPYRAPVVVLTHHARPAVETTGTTFRLVTEGFDVAPFLLGAGERLFDGAVDPGLTPVEVVHSPPATHVRYAR